jgi:phenylacetate-coenzyme A ligase PaaK-like adenylate-forming protein
MMDHEALLRRGLHASISVHSSGPRSVELRDGRTGFALELDELPEVEELQRELENGALRELIVDLGLANGSLELAQVRALQKRYREARAWDEQRERLGELLRYCVDSVPYYRARSAEYLARDIGSRQDLATLPIVDRETVRASFLELCSEHLDFPALVREGRLEFVSSSGTGAERVQAVADADLVRVPGGYSEFWAIREHDEAPRTAVLASEACLGKACALGSSTLASRIVHEHTLLLPALRDLFAAERSELEAVVEELHAFAPAFLLVNPVYAHWLGRRAVELGWTLPRFDALLSSYQFMTRVQRKNLERLFGCPVYDVYSATELGGCQVGLQCHRGKMHLREDHCLIEVVDPNGREVAAGQLGAVLVTTLAGEAVPLVRYAIGDLGSRDEEPCDCSLTDWPTFTLHGREKEALSLGGAWVTTRQIDDALTNVSGIDFYCLRQTDAARARLEVIPSTSHDFDAGRAATCLESVLPGFRIETRLVLGLEPARSAKYPTVRPLAKNQSWFSC